MSCKVLIFEPKKTNKISTTILWKAQMFPPTGYQSVGVTLLNDNIEVNNRRTLSEWENLLTENGFKYEVNYDHEYCKEYIIFDTGCVSFSFQIFACDVDVANYKFELAEENILPLLYILDLRKEGCVFPAALLRKINEAKTQLDENHEHNRMFIRFFRNLEALIDHCQQYEVDIQYSIIDK